MRSLISCSFHHKYVFFTYFCTHIMCQHSVSFYYRIAFFCVDKNKFLSPFSSWCIPPPTPSFSYYGLDCFEHIYVWKEKGSILLEELDLLGHMVVLYLSSWEPDRLCSTLGLHFHFLWQCVEGSLVSTSFQACVTVFLVCRSRSSEYEITLVTVLICVFLVANDTEQLLLQ